MTYLVLARKWRPRSFDTLIGQDHVVRALTHALTTQRLHHAWLFTGTRGVGKTTLSRILAKSLNCETGITATPCGVCRACTEIDAGRFVDYVELDAASNRGVEEMTQLLEQAVYSPGSGRFKVYMIDEVHMLTGHAFNAMLKTLEEPPPHVKFILATTDPQKIPVTVLSRCLQFNLKQMTAESIVGHLQHVLNEEDMQYETPALRLLAQAASGSMRDALSLTDQAIAYSAGNLTGEAVRGMLGTIDQRHLIALLQALAQGSASQVLAVADELAMRGLSYSGALADLSILLSRIAIEQRVPGAMPADDPLAEDIAQLAQSLHPDQVQLFYSVAVHSRSELSLAPDEYAGFVMACLRMLALVPAGTTPLPPGGKVPQEAAAISSDAAASAQTASDASASTAASASISPAAQVSAARPVSTAVPVATTAAVPAATPASTATPASIQAPAPTPTPVSTPAPALAAAPEFAPTSASTSPTVRTPTSALASASVSKPASGPASTSTARSGSMSGSAPAAVMARLADEARSGMIAAASASAAASAAASAPLSVSAPASTQESAPVQATTPAATQASASRSAAKPNAARPAVTSHAAMPAAAPSARTPATESHSKVSGSAVGMDEVPAWEDDPQAGATMSSVEPQSESPAPSHPQTAPTPAQAPASSEPVAQASTDDGFETMQSDADDGYFDDARFVPDDDGDRFTPDDDGADAIPGGFALREDEGVAVLPAGVVPPRKKKSKNPRLRDMTAQDWPALAASLPLSGLAAELARQSEWMGGQGDQVRLRVAIRSLTEIQGKARLRTVLSEHFGTAVQLDVEFGDTGDDTAHAVAQARRAVRQQEAEQAVTSDPLVLQLIEEFGARVVPGSIRAAEEKAA